MGGEHAAAIGAMSRGMDPSACAAGLSVGHARVAAAAVDARRNGVAYGAIAAI